jgi:endonuclease/exonuclease/phosphatase family metal-dependent hydrolase
MVCMWALSVTLFIAIVAIGGCQHSADLDRRRPEFAPAVPHLSVVTYNVNFGVAQPENVTRFLAESQASVICLQETHPRWESILRAALEEQYPHCVFQEWQEAGGMAVMSRYEVRRVRVLEPSAGWWPALLVELATPLGAVQVLNIHLKPPLSERGCVSLGAYCRAPRIHCGELAGFLGYVNRNRPLIIAGDFNENEVGMAMRSLKDQGFASALSAYDTRSKTWYWKTLLGLVLNDRYDHILFNDHLDCTGADVVAATGSDHLPVRAVMVRKSPLVALDDTARP